MTNEQENAGAPSRQSRPLEVLLRWGDPPGIITDVVERFFIGLAIVSLVSLLVTRGTSASRWAVTSSRKKEHKMPVATEVLAMRRSPRMRNRRKW